jgi:hypothetical protein
MRFRIFTLTVKRFAAGTWVKGIFTNGEASDITISAGVQQPTPDDIDLLEEGKRARKSIVVFTQTELKLPTETTNADVVVWDGEYYEVNVLKPFRTLFDGYKAVCTKIENYSDIPTPPEPD